MSPGMRLGLRLRLRLGVDTTAWWRDFMVFGLGVPTLTLQQSRPTGLPSFVHRAGVFADVLTDTSRAWLLSVAFDSTLITKIAGPCYPSLLVAAFCLFVAGSIAFVPDKVAIVRSVLLGRLGVVVGRRWRRRIGGGYGRTHVCILVLRLRASSLLFSFSDTLYTVDT